MEYPRLGYLPDAMVNFLALLGWSPGTNQELFSRDELIAQFTLEGISGGNAVFNPEKLDWFNQQYLSRLPPAELIDRVKPYLDAAGLWKPEYASEGRSWLARVAELLKPRIKRLDEFVDAAAPFLLADVVRDDAAVRKHLAKAELREPLESLRAAFSQTRGA
jgi:glutamyl/glutaminyl-tRNA synthetase